jgi:hypothetical protein
MAAGSITTPVFAPGSNPSSAVPLYGLDEIQSAVSAVAIVEIDETRGHPTEGRLILAGPHQSIAGDVLVVDPNTANKELSLS